MAESSEKDIQLKRAYIEAQVVEFGRLLESGVVLINQEEVRDMQVLLESILHETWEVAQKS